MNDIPKEILQNAAKIKAWKPFSMVYVYKDNEGWFANYCVTMHKPNALARKGYFVAMFV